ncbi:MAG: hypothetical protein IT462_03930 [Planctomycetes bacterium]|nr:hypothetical protein [Planctomycetota bacterium]
MLRALLICLLIAAPALSAQVFPKVDADEIKRALENAKIPPDTPVVETPEPTVDPKTPTSNAYKKYLDFRKALLGKKSVEKGDVNKSVDQMPAAIEVYLRAKAYLALGFYKDAGAEASRIKMPINDPMTSFNPVQEAVITEINNGGPWRLRVVAEVWEGYGDYETEDLLQSNWEKAKKEAQKIIVKFEEFVSMGGMGEQAGALVKRGMQNWLDNSYTHWKALWNAHRACKERGDEIAVWDTLIALTGPDRNYQNDDSPNYINARAAMMAVKECFSDLRRVKDGGMDLAIIRTHVAALQVDLALKACAVNSSTDAPMRLLMFTARNGVEKFRDEWLEDMKWK